MKKLTVVSILFVSLAFVAPVQASAATSAGVKPGSFLYFFDTAFENIDLFFTSNPEKKAQKALGYADERLAEIEAVAEDKNPDAVKTAIANYESNVALATEKSKEVKDKGQAETLFTSIADNASRNQEVLSAILIKVPEEAKAAIAQAIEASKKGQEEATKQITELKGEVEKLKQEVAELKKAENEKQATETEKLKKEIDELKKQQTAQQTKVALPKQEKIDTPVQNQTTPSVPTPSQNTQVQPTVYPTNVNYNGVNLTWCNGEYWKPCSSGKKLSCPISGGDATCVPDNSASLQPDLSNAANAKAQGISSLNQILSDLRSLETDYTSETNRMESVLNSFIGKNDSVSAIMIELTTLRRNRLMNVQSSLRSYISAVEGIKRTTEGTNVSAFTNFNSNQAFADDIKFVNDTRAAFQTDKASYDDTVRNYLSI